MKAVLMSIKPYWVFLIIAKAMGWNIDKEKTIEVRKSYPKDENWDKVVKIYCSKDKKSFAKIPKEYQPLMQQLLGKVIGEFVCNDVAKILNHGSSFWIEGVEECKVNTIARASCLDFADMKNYLGEKDGYAWHISDLVIYDKPKSLSDFRLYDCRAEIENGYPMPTHKINRPPQSWYYVEELR